MPWPQGTERSTGPPGLGPSWVGFVFRDIPTSDTERHRKLTSRRTGAGADCGGVPLQTFRFKSHTPPPLFWFVLFAVVGAGCVGSGASCPTTEILSMVPWTGPLPGRCRKPRSLKRKFVRPTSRGVRAGAALGPFDRFGLSCGQGSPFNPNTQSGGESISGGQGGRRQNTGPLGSRDGVRASNSAERMGLVGFS